MTLASALTALVAAVVTVVVLNEIVVAMIDKFAGPELGDRDFGERPRVPDGFGSP